MSSNEKIKIPHEKSIDFSCHLATGAVVVGPTPDDLYHITFFTDAIGIKTETGTPIEGEKGYKTSYEKDDLYQYREDSARISMKKDMMERLVHAINSQLKQKESDTEK